MHRLFRNPGVSERDPPWVGFGPLAGGEETRDEARVAESQAVGGRRGSQESAAGADGTGQHRERRRRARASRGLSRGDPHPPLQPEDREGVLAVGSAIPPLSRVVGPRPDRRRGGDTVHLGTGSRGTGLSLDSESGARGAALPVPERTGDRAGGLRGSGAGQARPAPPGGALTRGGCDGDHAARGVGAPGRFAPLWRRLASARRPPPADQGRRHRRATAHGSWRQGQQRPSHTACRRGADPSGTAHGGGSCSA